MKDVEDDGKDDEKKEQGSSSTHTTSAPNTESAFLTMMKNAEAQTSSSANELKVLHLV
jgi:hypothetical protein